MRLQLQQQCLQADVSSYSAAMGALGSVEAALQLAVGVIYWCLKICGFFV